MFAPISYCCSQFLNISDRLYGSDSIVKFVPDKWTQDWLTGLAWLHASFTGLVCEHVAAAKDVSKVPNVILVHVTMIDIQKTDPAYGYCCVQSTNRCSI